MNSKNTQLSDEFYKDGKKLIEILDKENFNCPVVLWQNNSEKGWTLLFGIPGLKLIGSGDIIGNMKAIIRENNLNISSEQIELRDSKDPYCNNLRSVFSFPGTGKVVMSATNVNGVDLPQSVVYRII